ncbi:MULTISPECIES: hypothetical protein [Neisseria]|uniref:Uncharacterized protein n=1 Tax=Neisseria macacae ATCC 33926 TaxID=997348 RepID=A0AA36UHM6_9NEIS|nr:MULTISPECIES: hypothetical protein [Neisseria]EGQ75883.1 hypothetical protein HMPREF9418_2222 [Neisseria macacae ATCC 33926]
MRLPTGFLQAERLTNTLNLLRLFVAYDAIEQIWLMADLFLP